MFARIGSLALAASLFALAACSAPVEPSGSSRSNIEKGDDDAEQGTAGGKGDDADTAAPEGKEQASGDGEGSGSTGTKDGKGEAPSDPSDPACVASCNSGLKAKCNGDETFCEDLCQWIPAATLSCMIERATSCAKSEFVACSPASDEDAPAPPSGGK